MKATTWCAWFFILAAPVAGQGTLTLSEAVARAERVHPAVAGAEAARARAASGAREARAARFPALALEAGGTHFEEPMLVAPFHRFDLQNLPRFETTLYQGAVSVAYTLFDGSARGARIDRAERLEEAAGAAALGARQVLAAQVAGAYLRVLALREQLDAQRGRLGAVGAEQARAALLFREGRAARLATLRADAAWSGAAADTVAAAGQLEESERALARLLAMPADSVRGRVLTRVRAFETTGPATAATVPERAAVLARALERSPEVARARAQLAAAEHGIGEARAQWLPRVQLGARYVEYGSTAGREAGEWQTGLELGFPLFTGGTRGAARDRAEAEVAAAAAELRAVELRTADGVDAALSAWATAQARVHALRLAVEQAVEVVRIEKLALDRGAGVQTDYLGAEADLLRARAALTDARFAFVLARIEVARLTGELDGAWLRTNLEQE
jgi:outer membrane protein TolC